MVVVPVLLNSCPNSSNVEPFLHLRAALPQLVLIQSRISTRTRLTITGSHPRISQNLAQANVVLVPGKRPLHHLVDHARISAIRGGGLCTIS